MKFEKKIIASAYFAELQRIWKFIREHSSLIGTLGRP